jgi:hypothetical protein
MNKLCDEYEAGNVGQGIAYLRAALDSEWWNRLIGYPICIVHRQLRVAAGSHSTTSPWAVVYLGKNLRGFAEAFADIGALYVPYRGRVGPADMDESTTADDSEREVSKDHEPVGSQTIQYGDFVITVHASARYLTLSNPYWDARDQDRLRRAILNISGVLPSQYSSVSKGRDGTSILIFSFQKGQADGVVSQIKRLLSSLSGKPGAKPTVKR